MDTDPHTSKRFEWISLIHIKSTLSGWETSGKPKWVKPNNEVYGVRGARVQTLNGL